MINLLGIALWGCLALGQDGARYPVENFENGPLTWNYVGGEEFPGAKGSLVVDTGVVHGGKNAARLTADFSGGGAYVGTWRDLGYLEGRDFKELRLWVRASNVSSIGVRLVDTTDQCHQSKVALPDGASQDWKELVLPVRSLVGGEHWGGANDGNWHGPAKAIGINLGQDERLQKTLWIDDVEAVLGSAIDGHPTLLSAVVNPPSCRAGYGTRLTYRWDAEPMGRDFGIFVHFQNAKGEMVFQSDHGPSVPTSIWKGHLEYGKTIVVPTNIPDGEYRIVLGLYDGRAAKRGWDHQPLKTGPGVTQVQGDSAYVIGTLKIDANAPLPKLSKPTLNLSGHQMTFNEEFNDLSVSAKGPGTRWIAHTPYWGDFGDAGFADPKDGFPFTTDKGILRIEAKKTEYGWRAGLLASVDPEGKGFSQKFGYFEMKAKFPKGLGTWPAFWLMGVRGIKDKTKANPEVDVIEQYGVMPNAMLMTAHTWGPGNAHWAEGDCVIVDGMADDFHTYGVSVEDKETIWYFDGVEVWKIKTPEDFKTPMYIMVDLAMGGGWPIDKAISPSFMYVDYVRAYAKK